MPLQKERPHVMANMAEKAAAGNGQRSDVARRIPYDDLRGWIAEAKKLGEIREAKGLSWQEDIGTATELLMHDEHAPCVVFEDIPGSLPGSRVLANFFAGRRRNMTLGFPVELSKVELSEAYRSHYMADLRLIPPKFVADGPVLENVMTEAAIDVLKFPTPKWHAPDGGRYIGTGSFNLTRDPDENWVNCGTYRVMIHDETSLGFYISPGKHGRIHRDKWAARNEPMPVVVVCGGDPLTFLISSTEVPYGVCEYDIVGGIRGAPVEVIKGPVTGLPFPARSEIVIEGFCRPGNHRPEGPFGEWTGYYGSDIRDEPVLDIKAIYHRNDPILFGCPPQRPPDEQARYRDVMRSALLREELAKAGIPDVTAVWAHEVGGSRLLLGVALKQRYAGHARQAGHVACQCHAGAYCGRYVIVVDDDIDVSDLDELMWAVCTRSDPATSIDFVTNAWSTPLDPRIEPERRARGDFTNSRAIIDACRPWYWRDKFPMVNMPTHEARRIARERFAHLLK